MVTQNRGQAVCRVRRGGRSGYALSKCVKFTSWDLEVWDWKAEGDARAMQTPRVWLESLPRASVLRVAGKEARTLIEWMSLLPLRMLLVCWKTKHDKGYFISRFRTSVVCCGGCGNIAHQMSTRICRRFTANSRLFSEGV